MTTYTIFGGPGDGRTRQVSSNYSTAIAAGGTASVLTGILNTACGQSFATPNYTITQLGLAFDTSVINDAEEITSVELSMFVRSNPALVSWNMEALGFNWGPTLATGTFRTNTQLSALSLLASLAVVPGIPVMAYNAFASQSAFLPYINKTGVTYLLLASSKNRLASAPTVDESAVVSLSPTTGTAEDPRLIVTAEIPSRRHFRRQAGGYRRF